MSEPLPWNDLSRLQRRVLERLWAGGTLRGQDPAVVTGLILMGYVLGERLTPAGEQLCSDALAAMEERMRTDKDRERRVALSRIAAAASPIS